MAGLGAFSCKPYFLEEEFLRGSEMLGNNESPVSSQSFNCRAEIVAADPWDPNTIHLTRTAPLR